MDTMPEKQSFLTALTAVLGDRGTERIYPCIRDLVGNGLVLSRFSADDRTPHRQDITQYLAAWCRYAGLTAEECRTWLTEYCMYVLSSISKTSLSGIRHSTKSNIRYIGRGSHLNSELGEAVPVATLPIKRETHSIHNQYFWFFTIMRTFN